MRQPLTRAKRGRYGHADCTSAGRGITSQSIEGPRRLPRSSRRPGVPTPTADRSGALELDPEYCRQSFGRDAFAVADARPSDHAGGGRADQLRLVYLEQIEEQLRPDVEPD